MVTAQIANSVSFEALVSIYMAEKAAGTIHPDAACWLDSARTVLAEKQDSAYGRMVRWFRAVLDEHRVVLADGTHGWACGDAICSWPVGLKVQTAHEAVKTYMSSVEL